MAIANYHSIIKAAMGSLLLACALIITASPYGAKAEISCNQVTTLLAPCLRHVVLGGTVAPACCQGIKDSAAQVKTKADLGASCQCVKDSTARFPGINYTRVNELPATCGTTVPYVVSPELDCSKVTLPN